jgi:hypothetical protein
VEEVAKGVYSVKEITKAPASPRIKHLQTYSDGTRSPESPFSRPFRADFVEEVGEGKYSVKEIAEKADELASAAHAVDKS